MLNLHIFHASIPIYDSFLYTEFVQNTEEQLSFQTLAVSPHWPKGALSGLTLGVAEKETSLKR